MPFIHLYRKGDAGGFLVPRAFALDVEAMTEAWLDLDFLAQFFSTTLGRYADVTSLADVRRRELTRFAGSGLRGNNGTL